MLKYLISEVQGMLPKGCENNFFTCLTAVVNKMKLDALPALQEMGVPTQKLYTFENDAIIHPHDLARAAKIRTDDLEYEALTTIPEAFWKSNKLAVRRLLEDVKKITAFSGQKVVVLHQNRKCLVKLVYEEADRYDKLENCKQSIIAKEQRILSYQELVKNNKAN